MIMEYKVENIGERQRWMSNFRTLCQLISLKGKEEYVSGVGLGQIHST